ncbi:ABC transporter permease [Haladaptatus caseinilyticus]|uniref:ABC transporter permease n=1 Tax=Haladaptatus caseinilyticus TaxID=2993314 RepID=UPI00224B5F9F|nr:ABC transporter permease [Haladaptatus caseinilyticus]
MSWVVVARKDFEDAIRSRMLWAVTALFVFVTAGFIFLHKWIDGGYTPQKAMDIINWSSTSVIPLTALVVTYLAIVGERDSGSIKLLLGLPHSRRDVVIGKFVGRSGVVAVATTAAFGASALVLLIEYGSFSVVGFLAQSALALLFALVFVSIALGFSAVTTSRPRAVSGAFGLFFFFQLGWKLPSLAVYYLLEGSMPAEPFPKWYFLTWMLNPVEAYKIGSRYLSMPDQQTIYASLVAGDTPFYLDGWFALVVLAVWPIVPVSLGYLRFRTVDLY